MNPDSTLTLTFVASRLFQALRWVRRSERDAWRPGRCHADWNRAWLDAPDDGAQFRSFLATSPDHERWELVKGVPIMMVPPTISHQRIAGTSESTCARRTDGPPGGLQASTNGWQFHPAGSNAWSAMSITERRARADGFRVRSTHPILLR